MKGTAIIAAFILIVIGSLIVGGFLLYVSQESHMTKMVNDSVKALYIAEAGLERKIYEINQGNFDDIDEVPFPFPVLDPNITYEVDVDDDDDSDGDIDDDDDPDDDIDSSGTLFRVTSTGKYYLGQRIVSQYARVVNIWDAAIFAGVLASGKLQGNTQIRGTVYILGEESFIDTNGDSLYDAGDILIDEDIPGYTAGIRDHFASSEDAISATGHFYIGNNYESIPGRNAIPSEFSSRIPSIEDADGVKTLDAELNVKYGKVTLGGSAQVGSTNTPDVKGYMDTVNVPDGFDPVDPSGKVYTDNLFSDRNRFSNKLRFPNLADPYGGYTYAAGGRMQYLKDNGLVLTVGVDIPATITPKSSFSISDGTNSFAMDGNGNLTVNGIIYIEGEEGVAADLTFDEFTGGGPKLDTIYYEGVDGADGKGTIVVTGNLAINTNFYTAKTNSDYLDGKSAYPEHNIIGFMTPNDIDLGTGSDIELMAIIYAGNEAGTNKKASIAGTILCNKFDSAHPNPEVFQVKKVWENLPPDMITIPPVFVFYNWHEVFEE